MYRYIRLENATEEEILAALGDDKPTEEPAEAILRRDAKTLTTKELINELQSLKEGAYAPIRERFMEINAELSARKQIPPSLRGLRRIQSLEKRCADDLQLMYDLQVIDLQWLHTQHRSAYRDAVSDRNLTRKLTQLCRSEEFSKELALEIAQTASADMQKCEALEISKFDQPEFAVLRSDAMRDQMNALMARYVRTERDIRSLAKRDRYAKGNEGSWARIWGAAEWLKLRSPAGYQISPKDLAEAYVAFGGTDIKPPSAVKKLLSVRKLLGEPPEPHLAISSDAPQKPLKSTLDAATPHNASTSPT